MTERGTAAETRRNATELLNCRGWEWYSMRMEEKKERLMREIFNNPDSIDDREALARKVLEWQTLDYALRWPKEALVEAEKNGRDNNPLLANTV